MFRLAIAISAIAVFGLLSGILLAEPASEVMLLLQQARQFEQTGRWVDAELLYKRSLELADKSLGEFHPRVLLALEPLARLYRSQGKYAESERMYQRALEVRKRVAGPNNSETAEFASEVAELYHLEGRLGEAESLHKQSLATVERNADARSSLRTARISNNLAALYVSQGRCNEAEPLQARAVEIAEKAPRATPDSVATALAGLASIYKCQGRDKDAEALLKRSLSVIEKAQGKASFASVGSLEGLGSLYRKTGRYSEAEQVYRQALEMREKFLGPGHPDLTYSLNSLAKLYANRSQFAAAEPLYRRALEIGERTLGSKHEMVSQALAGLGAVCEGAGRYVEAENFFRRAIQVRESALGYSHPDMSAALLDLGRLYHKQGRSRDAEPLYVRSLTILEAANGIDPRRLADVRDYLGKLYVREGRFEEAEVLLKRAIDMYRSGQSNPNSDSFAHSLGGLAQLYDAQGRHQEAEKLHKQALEISERVLGEDDLNVAIMRHNLALSYHFIGRSAEAEAAFNRSLLVANNVLGASHPTVSAMLGRMLLHYVRADVGHSRSILALQGLIERGRVEPDIAYFVLDGARKVRSLGEWQAVSDSYKVLQLTSSSTIAEAVTKVGERLAGERGPLAERLRKEQDFAAEIEKLNGTLVAAVSRPPKERNQSIEASTRERLAGLNADRQRNAEEIALRFPSYVALAKPPPLSLEDTQRLLLQDEALVAFDLKPQNSFVWVVTKDRYGWQKIGTNSAEMLAQVTELRKSLTVDANKPFDAVLSHKIYQQILSPVAPLLAGKKRLSVVTNGALTAIPFGLLVTTDPANKRLTEVDWLIKSYAVTVLPSIYSLKIMRSANSESKAPRTMVAFADPVFSKGAKAQAKSERVALRSAPILSVLGVRALGEALPQLPETRIEVQTIGAALGVDKKELKLGLDATEAAVKKTPLNQYRIVYFATHGLVAGELERFRELKAEPALALSIPDNPTELDDGLLQASEVAQMHLDADWVVLSACNTAAGDSAGAEALSGLARAFLYAGARSLVVSHWDVDDKVTAELMIAMFNAKRKTSSLSHGEALQEAILERLRIAKSEDEVHPRSWAPFIVVGEPSK